jgi:4-hydroxy-3-methylbut-2-enyl diphosphate reductase
MRNLNYDLTMQQSYKLYLCEPRGFCAGVERAVQIVELALQKYATPIYVRHEIVHNRYVVEDLRSRGVVFVHELSEIPDGAITIFSAHGISEKVENEAGLRALPVIDATCPLVTKVHDEAKRFEALGLQVILIGHAGHPEVEGTMGRIKGEMLLVGGIEDIEKLQVKDPNKLAYVTQTTLSVDDTRKLIDALNARFPNIIGPDTRDICYATQNRQNAVRELQGKAEILLVIGSKASSNSNRLRDLGIELGMRSYLIDDATHLNPDWLAHSHNIAITAGASAPEKLVNELVESLSQLYPYEIIPLIYKKEAVTFKLPKALVG